MTAKKSKSTDPYDNLPEDVKASVERSVRGIALPEEETEEQKYRRQAYENHLQADAVIENAQKQRERYLNEEKRLLALADEAAQKLAP